MLLQAQSGYTQELPYLPPTFSDQGLKDVDFLFPQRPARGGYKKTISVSWQGESVKENGHLLCITNGTIQLNDVISGNLLLRAESIEYNRTEQNLKATGNVNIEHVEFKMRCHRLEITMSDSGKEGQEGIATFGNAWGVTFEFPPSWTLTSNHVYFLSHPGDSLGVMGKLMGGGKARNTTEFHFKEVSVTPCPQNSTGWIAKTSSLDLKTGTYGHASGLQGYATLKNLVLKLGNAPILWLPWVLFPARIDRAAGLLPPSLGYHGRLGAVFSVPYFQPLGNTADITLSPTLYSREGVLWGFESRWAPVLTHAGSVNARYIRPRSTGESRYRVNMNEIWDMENGWHIRADINQASDQLMDAEFGAAGSRPIGTPAYNSSLYLGKEFRWAAFSMFASDNRSYFQADDPFYHDKFPGSMQKMKLPEGQLRFYPITIGNFYVDGGARFGRFGYSLDYAEDEPRASWYWNRSDYYLRLQGRLGQVGPFSADMQLGTRFTQYGAVLTEPFFEAEPSDGTDLPPSLTDNQNFDPFRVEGPSTRRLLSSSRLQVSLPQFGRKFLNLKLAGYSGDLKHIFEPYVAFIFNSKNDLVGLFPRFDEVDVRPGVGNTAVGERGIELAIKQHLFGRPDSTTMFADLVRLNTSIKYYFDPVIMSDGQWKRGWGSFDSSVDVEPSRALRLSFRRNSEHMGSTTDTSVSADVAVGKTARINLALFTTGFNQLQVRQRGVRTGGMYNMWGERLRMKFEATYDYERKIFSHAQVALAYSSPCVEYSIKYYHLALPVASMFAKEDRVDFVLTLKNLGELFSVEIGETISRLFR
jgi:hypothetical protein